MERDYSVLIYRRPCWWSWWAYFASMCLPILTVYCQLNDTTRGAPSRSLPINRSMLWWWYHLTLLHGRLGGFCFLASRALLIKKSSSSAEHYVGRASVAYVFRIPSEAQVAQVDKWLSTVVPLKVPIYWKGKPQNKCPMYPSCAAAAAPCEAGWVVPPIAHDCTRFESNNACWSGERRQSDFLETGAERERKVLVTGPH